MSSLESQIKWLIALEFVQQLVHNCLLAKCAVLVLQGVGSKIVYELGSDLG